MPTSQYVRHALHCAFGSTSTISHRSVFPPSHNRIFWFFAEGTECLMLLKITLKCLSLRVVLDLLNQVVNVNAMWSFHHRIWHAWDVEVDVFLITRKVELVRVWRCSITMFERTNFLYYVCAWFHKFPRSIVNIHDAIVFTLHKFPRSIWRTKFFLQPFYTTISREQDVFSCSTKKCFRLHKFPPFDHRLDWVWIGLFWKIQHEVLLQKTVERAFPTGCCSTVEPDWSFPLVQLWSCFNKIFGGGRGDKYTVFHTTSLQFSIFQLFKIQWAGSVPWRIIAFDRVW